MRSDSEEPRVVARKRTDPYEEASGGRRLWIWPLRLLLLFVAICTCAAASFVLYNRWQATGQRGPVQLEGGDPNLSFSERLYLETFLSSRVQELNEPAGVAASLVTFTVLPGEAASQVAANLSAASLLREPELFVNYVRYFGLDGTLAAGNYQLDPQLTIPELATALTNPYQEIRLFFLAGWRLEQMANYLAETRPANVDAETFLAMAQRRQGFDLEPYDFLVNHPAGASLEGFLAPGEYVVATDSNASDLVAMMLERFGEQVSPDMRQAFGVRGISVREAVTLASIVERETPFDDERGLIAGVFLNRLDRGMPLQADSTVQYALGFDDAGQRWWKSPLSADDLSVSSGYNTYLVEELPPGPIANPGLPSLHAVAYPEESSYLYFVLDCESQSQHLFSVTYEEHVAYVQRCLP